MSEKRGRRPGQGNSEIPPKFLELVFHFANTKTPASIINEIIEQEPSLTSTYNSSYKLQIEKYIADPSLVEMEPSKDKKKKHVFNERKGTDVNTSRENVLSFLKADYPDLVYPFEVSQVRIDYSKAYDRYKSIAKRSFERNLEELFFKYYYVDHQSMFKYLDDVEDLSASEKEKKKKILDKENQRLIDQNIFIPKKEDFNDPISLSKELKLVIKQFYLNMTHVQTFNTLFKYWVDKHLQFKEDKININEREFTILRRYAERKFDETLSISTFCKDFFHEDSYNRQCRYCGIDEKQITQLNQKDQIFTKRFYSRGKTIEVDQRDAYEGYTLNNIDLVCYWCNNSKTDEFSEEEFERVGKAIHQVWKKRLESIS
jgi:hypothetical protein